MRLRRRREWVELGIVGGGGDLPNGTRVTDALDVRLTDDGDTRVTD